MRAPQPRLARLYRLAAVPAQRLAAWRAAGDALAALAAVPDVGDDDALLSNLLGEPQLGQSLAAVLTRLATGAPQPEPAAALSRRPPGPGDRSLPRLSAAAFRPVAAAGGPVADPAAPAPRRPLPAQRPVLPPAPAGRPTLPWPHALRPRPDVPTPSRANPGSADPDRAAAKPRRIDAAVAADRLEIRAARASLLAAWHQVVSRPLAPPDLAAAAAPGRHADGAGSPGIDPGLTGPGQSRRAVPIPGVAQRPRLPTPMPDAPARPGNAGAALLDAARRSASAVRGDAVALQASRVGGFKGLAALGRDRVPAAPASVAVAASLSPPAVLPEPALLDAQSLIDQVESALREQALRSGVTLDGGSA